MEDGHQKWWKTREKEKPRGKRRKPREKRRREREKKVRDLRDGFGGIAENIGRKRLELSWNWVDLTRLPTNLPELQLNFEPTVFSRSTPISVVGFCLPKKFVAEPIASGRLDLLSMVGFYLFEETLP